MTRAIALGGCPKAADNCMRVKELLHNAWLEMWPLPPSPLLATAGALIRFTFEDGQLGLFLSNHPNDDEAGEIIVTGLVEGSQAERCGVPVGAIVVALNGKEIGKLAHAEFKTLLRQQSRPLTLLLRWPETESTEADRLNRGGGGAEGGGEDQASPLLLPGGGSESIAGICE